MAIGFDAQSAVAAATATSLTFAHTCTGSDRILFVNYHGDNGGSDLITGITYNGVAMTQVGSSVQVPSDRWIGMYYLIAPATGANNVVLTASSSSAIRASGTSYTGAKQSAQPDSTNSGTNTTTDGISVSTTVVASNCWMMMFLKDQAGNKTYVGETMRLNADAGGQALCDSNATVGTGSQSLSVTSGDSLTHGAIIVSFSPVVAGGLTNVKTVDGIAIASVKTKEGIAIASVKSINGIT